MIYSQKLFSLTCFQNVVNESMVNGWPQIIKLGAFSVISMTTSFCELVPHEIPWLLINDLYEATYPNKYWNSKRDFKRMFD